MPTGPVQHGYGQAGSTFGKHGLWRVSAPVAESIGHRGDDGV
jgi:hypothetical protein